MKFADFLKKIQWYVLGLGIFVFLIFLIGFLLPRTTTNHVSYTTELPPSAVFEVIATASSWTHWSPIAPQGTGFRFRSSGSESGIGSVLECTHNGEQLLTLSITDTRPGFMVTYDIESSSHPSFATGVFELEIVDGKTQIDWKHTTDWSYNPILKIMGRLMSGSQERDMQMSLQRLVERAENR